jgi:uncharacterized DUF497 family protein
MTYDPKKRKSNKRKHKVELTEGYAAFDAPMVTQEDTREYDGEQRFISLGRVKDKVVVLVWVDGETTPHLISCRKAEPHEQEAYFKEYPQI